MPIYIVREMGGKFASWLLQLVSFSCGWFLQIFLLCNFLKIKKKSCEKKPSKGDLPPCFARYDIHEFIGKSHKLLFHNFPFTQSYAITIKWDFERDSPNNAYIHKAWGDLKIMSCVKRKPLNHNHFLTWWKKERRG